MEPIENCHGREDSTHQLRLHEWRLKLNTITERSFPSSYWKWVSTSTRTPMTKRETYCNEGRNIVWKKLSGPALFACPWLLLLGLSSLSWSDVCSHKILAVHTSQQHDNSDERHIQLQKKLLLLLFLIKKLPSSIKQWHILFHWYGSQTLNILLCLSETRGVMEKDIHCKSCIDGFTGRSHLARSSGLC